MTEKLRRQRIAVIGCSGSGKTVLAHQIAQQPEAVDPVTKAALAFRTLSDHSRSLELLNGYETRYDRQFNRCVARLAALKHSDFSKQT